MSTNTRKPLPPLRTRLQPFLDDLRAAVSAESEPLAKWRPTLKTAGPFRGTERWRATVQVVRAAADNSPPSDVEDRVARVLSDWEAAKDELRRIAEANQAAACKFIRETRARTGTGPLWREVAGEFGVTGRYDVSVFIWHLRRIGAVEFTQERGSLDIANAERKAEEAEWTSARWAQEIRKHVASRRKEALPRVGAVKHTSAEPSRHIANEATRSTSSTTPPY